MRANARQSDNAVYFIVARATELSRDIVGDVEACLGFIDTSANTHVSMSGTIAPCPDRDKLHENWTPRDDAYFSGGKTDENAALLRFTPDLGEYWDSPSNPVTIAIQFIKAKVTGAAPSLGENKKIPMG
jgi:general stress protein 26